MFVLLSDVHQYNDLTCDVTVYKDDYGNIKVDISLRSDDKIGIVVTIPSSHISDLRYEKNTSFGDLIDLAIRGCKQHINEIIDNLKAQGKI